MRGPLALHGGGEFLPGDEPFLDTLLRMAPADRAVIVAIVPTAGARGRPDLIAAHGVAAIEHVVRGLDFGVRTEAVLVVDRASAMDPDLAGRLAAATVIHLPGGDPDLIPTLFPGSAAWAAIRAAHANGAVLAGASAGAMALGSWTWTPSGGVAGLGAAPGIVVVPHADARSWAQLVARFGATVPVDLGVLGIAERTAVVIEPGGPWRVVGEGEARWVSPAARAAGEPVVVARHGDTIGP